MSHVNISTIVDLSTELKNAVKSGDIPKIVELVESGAPTDTEIGGIPILLYAAQRDLWDIVEELFILNADLDIKYDVLDWTLIHQMAMAGKNEQLENYLPFIESKNVKDNARGQNALMIACEAGHKETFKILMDAGVELRGVDLENNNALHYVAKAGWQDILELVAEKHYQLFSLPNKNGDTVLSLTATTMSDFIKDAPVETKSEAVDSVSVSSVVDGAEPATDVKTAKKKLSSVKKII